MPTLVYGSNDENVVPVPENKFSELLWTLAATLVAIAALLGGLFSLPKEQLHSWTMFLDRFGYFLGSAVAFVSASLLVYCTKPIEAKDAPNLEPPPPPPNPPSGSTNSSQ